MNNFNNYVVTNNINSQLQRAEIQKRVLIRNIYREYEHYLNIIRDLLCISVEKGLNNIFSYLSINDSFLNENQFSSLFKRKISKIVYKNLPLLTVEQLKIMETEKNINEEIIFNTTGSSEIAKADQKEKFQYEDTFQLEVPIQFQISKDISNTCLLYTSPSPRD